MLMAPESTSNDEVKVLISSPIQSFVQKKISENFFLSLSDLKNTL